MSSTKGLIKELKDTRNLNAVQFKSLLEDNSPDIIDFLHREARESSLEIFGNGIFIRGLIEISNHCKNNCFYCGIRADNTIIRRYRLSSDEVLDCCRAGYSKGFRTFVLQGGEDPAQKTEWVETVVRKIKTEFPDCAVTLSIGEKTADTFKRFRNAGADRYLLRHETFDREHYERLHPSDMSAEHRIECLNELKALSYQTGTGIMVGSPYQTVDNIVSDLMFIKKFNPEMIGIGPFVHHNNTPFKDFADGSVELTLKLISILRLMNPHALIPATTSLSTLAPDGRKRGILAGANVLMPNLTPAGYRNDYALYEGKVCIGAESSEGLDILEKELKSIGYSITVGRGDYYLN